MRSSGNRQGIFDLQKGKEAKTASEVEKRGEWAMAKWPKRKKVRGEGTGTQRTLTVRQAIVALCSHIELWRAWGRVIVLPIPRSCVSQMAPPAQTGGAAPPARPAPTYTIPIVNQLLRIFCRCCTTPNTKLVIRPPSCPRSGGGDNCCVMLVDIGVYLLGPILICLASAIIFGLTHTFFYVMLPMLASPVDPQIAKEAAKKGLDIIPVVYTKTIFMHIAFVFFLLVNVLHNYVLCVTTRNNGPAFDRVVRELAEATDYLYPETEEEMVESKRAYEQKMIAKGRARRDMARQRRQEANVAAMTNVSNQQNGRGSKASTPNQPATNPTPAPAPPIPAMPAWMLMGAREWGWCLKSNQPKPPRSHYDHVTKSLVLNME